MRSCRVLVAMLVLFLLTAFFSMSAMADPPPPPYTPLADPSTIEEPSFYPTGPGYFVCDTEEGLTDCEIHGLRWNFKVPWEDQDTGKQALKSQLGKDGVRIVTERDGAIYADKRIEDDTVLHMSFTPSGEGYSCEMSREVTLLPENAVRFSLSQEIPEAAFYTVHDGRSRTCPSFRDGISGSSRFVKVKRPTRWTFPCTRACLCPHSRRGTPWADSW